MVHGGHHRQPGVGEGEQTGSQALVVVHEIEIVFPLGQQPGGAQRERPRFREARRPHRQQFQKIDRVADLTRMGHPERVRLPVQVEGRNRYEVDTPVEHRVGLAAEDRDLVAEPDQFTGQVAGVHALAPAVWVSPVGEIGDAEAVRGLHERHRLDRSRPIGQARRCTTHAPATRSRATSTTGRSPKRT